MTFPGPLARWVWQSTLRDRRQHLLIVFLAAASVAAISVVALFVDQLSVSTSLRYGRATHSINVADRPDQRLVDVVASAEEIFDDPQVVYQTPTLRFPGGSAEPFALDQMPGESFGGASPSVLEGRLPSDDGELAITPRISDLFSDLDMSGDVGSVIDWGTDHFEIVGIIADPNDTNSELILVAPETIENPVDAQIVVDASDAQFAEFSARHPALGWEDFAATDRNDALNVVAVYMFAIVAMLVVGLLCSAGFYVMHQRRARQYAVLASLGATPSQLRRAMILTGATTGLLGGIIGAAIGTTAFVAARPIVERVVNHEIPLSQISPTTALPAVALCVATTIAASLAPARTIASSSLRSVLQPAVRRSVRRPTTIAAVIATIGVLAFQLGTMNTLPIAAVAFVLAALFSLPLTVNGLAIALDRFSIGWRIIGGELARSRSKTIVSISALTIIATATATVSLVAAAHDLHVSAQPPNVPGNVTLIHPEEPTTSGNHSTPDAVERIADSVPNSRLVPILAPVNANGSLVQVSQQVDDLVVEGEIVVNEYQPWIATPELLAAFGADSTTSDMAVDVLATQLTPVELGGWNLATDRDRTQPDVLDVADYSSVPPTWITQHGVDTNRYGEQVIAWALVTTSPLATDDTNAMFAIAGTAFSIEPQIDEPSPPPVATIGLTLGATTSLIMTASLVALIANESRRDHTTLTAVGASRNTTRLLAARTGLLMTAIAAVLALPLSYTLLRAVAAGVGSYPATLSPTVLAVNALAIPAAAAVFSYVTGGSQTASHRRLLD